MNLTQLEVLLVGLGVFAGLGVIAAFRSGAPAAPTELPGKRSTSRGWAATSSGH